MHLVKRFATLAFLGSLFLTSTLLAQRATDIWKEVDSLPQKGVRGKRGEIHPGKGRATRLAAPALRQLLSRAPLEVVGKTIDDGEIIALPMPDGGFARFRFVESPVMEPELAAKYPEIKTYAGVGIDDPSATIRFDLTPAGFHAQILSPKGAVYIDPQSLEDTELHVSYYKRDYQRVAEGFTCLVPQKEGVKAAADGGTVANRSGTVLRTYRLACAATGEYTAYHGGTVSSALAAITTAINRVNQIYEAEISVRLVLVASNNSVIFTNGGTDPYDNEDGFAMLDQNISTLDSVIGSGNYDIGHVFSTGGGGVAYLGSVCSSDKGGGVTGLPEPDGDGFYVDFVAHEIGHQFGANHTFNSETGNCGGGTREPATAYEPGSGSTIMAYAGICESNNLQSYSDPYFHSVSFDEIVAFLSSGGTCAATTSTGNTVPSVSAGSNYTIPKGTPFTLTASGSDANGDALTYCWEQRDLGGAQNLNDGDNGSSPLFRSFNPTTSPSRTFPMLSNILANTSSPGEKLPTVSRTMKFRVTARDNRAGGGGVNTSDMQVVVDGASGPFVITAPNSSVTWSNVQTVTWNVAGSASAPVNCSHVNIRLSTDGGNTFPTVLIANTPNDGSQAVILPSLSTTTARIKVEAVGNIFFDISNVNFSLVPYVGGAPAVGVEAVTLIAENCSPSNNAIDPNETVQLRLALKNFGSVTATNVTAALLADSGVIAPTGSQNFGDLSSGGAAVTRDFSFTANGSCGGTLQVRFEIRTNNVVASVHTNSYVLGGLGLSTQSRTNTTQIRMPALAYGDGVGVASPYPSAISVSGIAGNIEKVTVTLIGFGHAYPSDLDVLLVGPGGQSVVLMSGVGGGEPVVSANVTVDDAAAASFPASSLIISGSYKPTAYYDASLDPPAPASGYGSALSVFNNTTPNGTWSLYIKDWGNGDTGTIVGGWRINITTIAPNCCQGNSLPVISSISNQTINEDAVTGPIAFTVSDAETAAGSLVVTGSSSNTNLVPNANVVIGGSGGNRNVTLTPAPNQSGSSTITISAFDGSGTSTRTFVLTVNPVNDAPVLSPIAGRTIHLGSTLLITNQVTDVDSSPASFSFDLPVAPSGASVNSQGVLSWTPASNQLGTHSFTMRVFDNGSPNLSDTESFSVSVVPAPSQTVTRSGNQLTLQWSAISGRQYQVQMKTNLNEAVWSNVTTVNASGSSASFIETVGPQQKYFRIRLLE